MEPWHGELQDNIVEAIEEGKVVRVPESYAKTEGLLIIRRPLAKKQESKKKEEEEARITFEDLRKPLNWKKNQVITELEENFHWLITKRRKERNLTRRQLAKAISESENNIKLVENGILPRNDFIIINKLQSFLNINLRKDRKDFAQSPRSLIESNSPAEKENKENIPKQNKQNLMGDDIEIID